jgi:hypothetical protein
MEPLGRLRKSISLAILSVGVISFFLPLVSITAPIIGRIQWSALNVVSQLAEEKQNSPSLSGVSKAISRQSASDSDRGSAAPRVSHEDVPLGIAIAPFIPFEIYLTYLLLIPAVLAVFMPVFQKLLGPVSVLGLVSSGFALVSVFLFGNAIQQSMATRMNSPEMQNNPFAAIGQALAQSFRVEPGIALYLLVLVMAGLLVVLQCQFLDRLTVGE